MPLGRPYAFGLESPPPFETGDVAERGLGESRQRTLLTAPQVRGGAENLSLNTESRPGMRRRRNARTIAASAGAA